MRTSPLKFGNVYRPVFKHTDPDRLVPEEKQRRILEEIKAKAEAAGKNTYLFTENDEFIYAEDNCDRTKAAATGKTVWEPALKGWARLNPFNYLYMQGDDKGQEASVLKVAAHQAHVKSFPFFGLEPIITHMTLSLQEETLERELRKFDRKKAEIASKTRLMEILVHENNSYEVIRR